MDKQIELLSSGELARAVELLLREEIVAFPTETVYGLGACLFLEKAIQKIFIAKGRPSDNPLIVHISHLDCLSGITSHLSREFYVLAEAFFPGPLTLVVPKSEKLPDIVSAGLPTVAIRMPSHPVAKELISGVGQPIVAPSANRSGRPSATCYQHVLDDFEGRISAVITGECCKYGIESTVVSLLEEEVQILRPGSITKEQIEKVIGRPIKMFQGNINKDQPLPSPGMKYRHYAPEAKVLLFEDKNGMEQYLQKQPSKKRMLLSIESFPSLSNLIQWDRLSPSNLYAQLRKADQMQCEEVVVFCSGEVLKDEAMMNRLRKAEEK